MEESRFELGGGLTLGESSCNPVAVSMSSGSERHGDVGLNGLRRVTGWRMMLLPAVGVGLLLAACQPEYPRVNGTVSPFVPTLAPAAAVLLTPTAELPRIPNVRPTTSIAPTRTPVPTRTLAPAPPTATHPAASPTLVSTPSPEPSPTLTGSPTAAQWVVVANTDGLGVFLQREPRANNGIVVLAEGTLLEVAGAEVEEGSGRWLPVRTEDGSSGWVSVEYVIPAPAP